MDGPTIHPRPCAKYNRRPPGVAPRVIVIHFSATLNCEEVFQIFHRGPRPVSAHYLIDDRGLVYGLVDERHRAWHAGESAFRGVADVNSYSIGIELRNAGQLTPGPDGNGLYTVLGSPFPAGRPCAARGGDWWECYAGPQLLALDALCAKIAGRYRIGGECVVGHSEVALPAGRKVDPGPLFDWSRLRSAL